MEPAVELVLVRHGLPVRQELDPGDRADPPLDALGLEQARRAAAWLSEEAPFHAVYASPMRRARETAEPFAETAGLPLGLRDGVSEFDRDHHRYVPLEALKREDPEAWRAFAAGGYSEGVDIHSFHATVVNTLEPIVRQHAGQRVVVFCHGGVINVWTAHVLGLTPALFFEPAYASIHRFLCARTGQRNLLSLNETGHLRGLPRP